MAVETGLVVALDSELFEDPGPFLVVDSFGDFACGVAFAEAGELLHQGGLVFG